MPNLENTIISKISANVKSLRLLNDYDQLKLRIYSLLLQFLIIFFLLLRKVLINYIRKMKMKQNPKFYEFNDIIISFFYYLSNS